ncbi:LuxR C-terminal-related transcriptional regulator [Mumia sp. DW29H23]|uniref:LuxR C-terminal-related transcriptional regulator n=1 Tax=Mumia sp. DW29H23 TaxID=3421241 RepID=UPI003D697EE5
MRIAVVDDAMIIREGLTRLLAESGCEVVAAVASPERLAPVVEADAHLDAVVVDIRMPPTHTDEGLALAAALRSRHPRLGILVLSQYLESHYASRLLQDTPEHTGYLLKDRVSEVGVLVDALRRVTVGECVIDPTIVSRLLNRPRPTTALSRLTTREREVLSMMAEGRSNHAIAAELCLGARTVEAHVRQIMQKLDLPPSADDHRRVLAVLRYLQDGSAEGRT